MADMLIWPFPHRDPSQEGRTDQGWDLVGPPGGPVRAVASGTFHMAGPDPGGFGTDYPVQTLDQPITFQGHTFNEIYYGHTHMAVPPGHYDQGTVIAHTGGGGLPAGGSGSLGEVELGFGDPNKPGGISQSYGGIMRAAMLGAVNMANGGDPGTAVAATVDPYAGLSAVGSAISGIASSLSGFNKMMTWISIPNHWTRILSGGVGIVLVFMGIMMLGREVRSG